MAGPAFDVLGLGNAIVDVFAHAHETDLDRLGLVKGAMTLIDVETVERLYGQMGPAVESSGGSCANTMAAIASLGGRSAYIGRVRNDQLGAVFGHDMRAAGVTFRSAPAREGLPTARCLVFVTPDAQRTMATYLGACVELAPADVDAELVRGAAITFLEGYLWDRTEAKAACLEAAALAHAAGGKIALTLSDSFCVDRWRAEFRALIDDHVDILVANEAEITSLFENDSFEAAVGLVRERGLTAALTRGPLGCVVLDADDVVEVPQDPVERVVDTTGAGDAFSAGFLFGLSRGLELEQCGRLGNRAAARVIGQLGARPLDPLAPLVAELAAA